MRQLLVGTMLACWSWQASGQTVPADTPAAPPPDAAAPMATSLFDTGIHDRPGARDLGDLLAEKPGILAVRAPVTGDAAWTSRGGSDGVAFGLPSSVTLFLDGVAAPRMIANDLWRFDVAGLAVERGPQSIGFGAGAAGGAVSLRLSNPGENISGYGEVAHGRFSHWLARGGIALPLTGDVGLSLQGYYEDNHGPTRNLTTGERLNDRDRAGIRLALSLTPTDRIRWDASVIAMRSEGEALLDYRCDGSGFACGERYATTGLPEARPAGGAPRLSLPLSGDKALLPLGRSTEALIATSRLEWSGERLALRLVTGAWQTDEDLLADLSDGREWPTTAQPLPPVRGWPEGGQAFASERRDRHFSQEVRLAGSAGPLDLAVGALLVSGSERQDRADFQTLLSGGAATPLLLADRTIRIETESVAGFVDADLHLGSQLTLTAGVRVTDETRKLAASDNGACETNCFAAMGGQERSDTIWTPRASLQWRPVEVLTFHVASSRGYSSGGWAGWALTPEELVGFGPSTVWNHEVGARLDMQGWSAAVTGFWLDARDEAVATAGLVDGRLRFGAFVADRRNRGVEVELAANPYQQLRLWLNGAWQDNEYRDDIPLEPVGAPEWSVGGGARWDVPIPRAGIILSPEARLLWRSDYWTDALNVLPVESNLKVDAALAIATDDGAWRVAVECANCFNADKPQATIATTSYLMEPRVWWLSARRRF